jgi:hypothetical protein
MVSSIPKKVYAICITSAGFLEETAKSRSAFGEGDAAFVRNGKNA